MKGNVTCDILLRIASGCLVGVFSALQHTSPTVYCISKAKSMGLLTRAQSVDHRGPLKSCIFGPRGIAETCLCSTLGSTGGGTHGALTRAYQGKVAPQGVINLSLQGQRLQIPQLGLMEVFQTHSIIAQSLLLHTCILVPLYKNPHFKMISFSKNVFPNL